MTDAHILSVILDACRANRDRITPDLRTACSLATQFLLCPRETPWHAQLYALFSWLACEGPLPPGAWNRFRLWKLLDSFPAADQFSPVRLFPLVEWTNSFGPIKITQLGFHVARELWGHPDHWRPQFVHEAEELPPLDPGDMWVSPVFLFQAHVDARAKFTLFAQPLSAVKCYALTLFTGQVRVWEKGGFQPFYQPRLTGPCPVAARRALKEWKAGLPAIVASL